MGQRLVAQIFNTTGGAAGLVDTGIMPSEQYDAIKVYFAATGAAAPTGVTVNDIDDAGAVTTSQTVTIGIGGTAIAQWMPGIGVSGGGTANVFMGVPPRRIRVSGTGGAASTLRIWILGIKWQ